jgi:hypothetical protein
MFYSLMENQIEFRRRLAMGYRSDVAYTIRFAQFDDGQVERMAQRDEEQNKASPENIFVETSREFADKFNARAKELFYMFLAEAKVNQDTEGVFTEDDECFEIDEPNLALKFRCNYVKWDSSFPDVACHNNLLDLAGLYVEERRMHREFYTVGLEEVKSSQLYDALGYLFVRVGENVEDIEERYGGEYDYDWCFCSRQIVTDWD